MLMGPRVTRTRFKLGVLPWQLQEALATALSTFPIQTQNKALCSIGKFRRPLGQCGIQPGPTWHGMLEPDGYPCVEGR